MPTIVDMHLDPPLDWPSFQRLCLDLWKSLWNNPNIHEYGRIGQRQNGVDIQGRINNGEKYGGVQCKEKDNLAGKTLTITELKAEVTKALQFTPALSEYVLAYSGPRNVSLQDEANRITESHRIAGLFSVSVWSWEDIRHELASHPDILRIHYPELFSSSITSETITKDVVAQVTQEIRIASDQFGKSIDNLSTAVTDFKQDIIQYSGPQLDTELSHTKKLLESFKPKSCLEYLEELIRTKWDGISDKVKCKLLTKKGFCLLQLGKSEEAALQFVRALQYDCEDEKAITNAALGYSILRDMVNARKHVDAVLVKNPLNLEIWTIQIQFAITFESLQAIWSRTPKNLLDKPEILWAHSVALQRFESNVDAEQYLTKALQNDTERRIDLLVQLGSLRLKNCLDNHRIIGSNNPTTDALSILNESILLFTEALKRLTESDIVPVRIQALLNRGIAFRFRASYEESKKDLDQVIEWDKDNYQAVKHRSIVATIEGQHELAIALLHPFAQRDNLAEARILLADNYRLHGQPTEALKILQDCSECGTDSNTSLHGLIITLESFIALGDRVKAFEVVDKMKTIAPNSFVPFIHQSRIEKVFGNKEVAREIALTAKSLVGTVVDYFDERHLAEELFELELFSDAATIYGRIAVQGKNDGVTRRLVESYYKAEMYDKALEWCNGIRSIHPDVQYATEIAAAIHEDSGNLNEAISILRDYLKRNPNDSHAQLRLASALWRAGLIGESEHELQLIKEPLKLGSKGIVHFGGMLVVRGDVDGAITLFYEARRLFPNDADIDMAYISSILGQSDRITILVEPEMVSKDTAVFLETKNGDKAFYIIEDRLDSDGQKNEINLNNPIAKDLIGKHIGDQIDLEKNPVQPRLWMIRGIKNKYTHALHDSMENHPRRFPNRGDFFVITTPTNAEGEVDGEELRKQMIAALPAEGGRIAVEEHYKAGKLTLGCVSNVVQRDLLATMVHFASKPELGIFSNNGTIKDYQTVLETIKESKGFVVDATAIIIMEFLESKEWMNNKYGPFFITQSTIDGFNKILRLRSLGGMRPSLAIFQERGELFKQEVTVEEKQKQIDSLSALINWLNTYAVVKPVDLALTMKRAEKEEMDKLFEGSIFDSLLVAKSNNLSLFSEDGRFRQYGESVHKIKGIWSHGIIKDAFIKSYIDEDKYVQLTLALVSMNVHHVSIDSKILIAAAKKANWRADYPLMPALYNLSGMRCDEDPAIVVAGEFIFDLWTQTISLLNKETLIMAVLNSLSIRRNIVVITNKLASYLEQKFRLWPQASNAIVGLIQSWTKSKVS